MEEKKNNNNLLLIIIGLVLVAGISLFVGISIGNSNNDSNVSENTEQNNKDNTEEVITLDEVTALTLVQYLYNDAMKVYNLITAFNNGTFQYENGRSIYISDFEFKELEEYANIANYNNIMNDIFTKKGLEQFEKFILSEMGTNAIKKENNVVYIKVPASGFFAGYYTKNLKVKNIETDKIEATIDVIDAPVNETIKTKNITIKKENNKWLVEEFAIPNHK